MSKSLFPEVPDGLEGLSAEELQGHIAALRARVAEVKTRDPEIVGDLSMTELLEQVQAAVEQIETISGVLATREAAETQFEDELAKLADKAGVVEAEVVAEDDGDGDDDGAVVVEAEVVAEAVVEPEVIEEPVLELVAGGAPAAKPSLPTPAPVHNAVVVEPVVEPRASLVAASGIPGISDGIDLTDKVALAKAIMAKRYQSTSIAEGVEEKVIVASARYGELFPEERRLYGDANDAAKIEAVVGEEALTASGGLCAPVSNYYELMNVSVADRPVRDAMANFNAVRGGLKFAAPPTIGSVTGIGIKTAAQDALGGTFATKSCQTVACPAFTESDLAMIYHCVKFGNLNSRAFPEMIAQFDALVLAAHARLAEQALLDYVKSTSTNVTDAGTYGAVPSLLNAVLFAGAGMRSRHRMSVGSTFRVLLPEWVGDQAAADMANRQFTDFNFTRNDVADLLRKQGVNVTWYMDTPTGAGQVFGTQTASSLLRFPTTVKWAIYPEGSYLFLDGGTLDLGIVRDSSLNLTNDFQIFGETFEAAAFVGVESLYVTSTICASGTVAGTSTPITCP